jgi:hypothetical protein
MLDRPVSASSLVRALIGSNPFYLISACCMLGGCLALTNSLSWMSVPIPRLLILIGTLNVYEAALIGLAAYLIARRKLLRDGVVLLLLEAFFLVDVTFLNAEIATAKLGLGIAVAAALFIAATIKLWVAMRLLGTSRIGAQFAFILVVLAAILVIPIVFAWIDHGSVAPIWFYGAWWLAGGLLAIYEVLVRLMPQSQATPSHSPPSHSSGAVLTYLAVPWLSLVGHLGILHYVYDVPFFGADAAPLLLGFTLLLNRLAPVRLMPRKDVTFLRLLLPLAAVMVSLNNPHVLWLELGKAGHILLTPQRLTLGAAYLTYVCCFFPGYWLPMIAAGVAVALASIYGPTPAQMQTAAQRSWSWSSAVVYSIVPKTADQWGTTAVGASFAFLVLGAAISLRRRPPEPDQPTRTDPG